MRAGRRLARGRAGRRRPVASRAVSPFWIWMQVLIVVFVLAGIVIAAVNLL